MQIVLFNFARNLKFSRFTIDVLMQRLTDLKAPRHPAPEEYERLVGRAHESVTACDHLCDELRGQLYGIQSFDVRAIASWSAGLEELHRKITESIARLNSLEYGTGLDLKPTCNGVTASLVDWAKPYVPKSSRELL
jgi:hypothetical protein